VLANRTIVRRTAFVLAVPAACVGLIGVAQFVAPSSSPQRASTELVDSGGLLAGSGSPADPGSRSGEAGQGADADSSTAAGTSTLTATLAGALVRGHYLLRGPSGVPPGGSVLFVLQGPTRVVKAAPKAPFTVRIDTRGLTDGAYQVVVSTVVGGKRTVVRTDRITVANGGGVATPTGVAGPAVTPARKTPAPTASRKVPKTREAEPSARASQGSSLAAQVITLTNQQRVAGGCKALTADTTLASVALAHSQDMAAHDYFEHDSQDGRSPFDRMTAAGYRFGTAAENIAAGQRTAQEVVTAWMNSAGHRANIMNCALTEIGVGHATGGRFGTYWTQDFGTPR
jgi:uncharacterized protein YkwD